MGRGRRVAAAVPERAGVFGLSSRLDADRRHVLADTSSPAGGAPCERRSDTADRASPRARLPRFHRRGSAGAAMGRCRCRTAPPAEQRSCHRRVRRVREFLAACRTVPACRARRVRGTRIGPCDGSWRQRRCSSPRSSSSSASRNISSASAGQVGERKFLGRAFDLDVIRREFDAQRGIRLWR